MKNIITFLFIFSAMCSFVCAQSLYPELEIAKEIKLLKSTRLDVKAIMSEFDSDEEDPDSDEDEDEGIVMGEFRSDNAEVRVYYSSGGCSKDADDGDAPEWIATGKTATKVVIVFDDEVKLKDLGLDLSGFKKQLQYEDEAEDEDSVLSNDYIYYDEKAGIIVTTNADEVKQIILHPQKEYLCNNEINSEILSGEKNYLDAISKSVIFCRLKNYASNVTNLDLKTNGVFGCKDEKCLNAKKEISVTTTANDADGDQLVYNYIVSGGKIDGSGANVIWNLTGVAPGKYTITAGTDDGCGICGETKTQEITLKENSYEFIPPARIKKLILDKTELVAACPVGRLRRVSCPAGNCGISVTSAAEGENLTYIYKTYGGKIIGSGDKVVWDLSGQKPGEYSIMISASDDGENFGEWETRTVTIKENPDCTAPKKILEEK